MYRLSADDRFNRMNLENTSNNQYDQYPFLHARQYFLQNNVFILRPVNHSSLRKRPKQEDSYSAIDDPVTTEDSDEIQIDYPVLDDLDLDSTSMLYLYILLKPKRDWMTSS